MQLIMFVLVEIYMGVNLENSNCFSLMLSSTSFQLHNKPRSEISWLLEEKEADPKTCFGY